MAINVTFRLVDDYGRITTKTFVGEATTLAQAAIDAAALLSDLMAVSLLGCDQITYSEVVPESQAVEAGANLDAGGTLHLRLDNGKLYALKIPGIDPALVNSDGTINIAAAAITDLIANFEAAGAYKLSETNVAVSIKGGELDR